MVVVSPTSRWDFVHKQTTSMVRQCAALATEQLALKMMSRCAKGTVETPRRRVRQKAGLNREILLAGFGMAHAMLGLLGPRAQTAIRAHACLPALRARHAARPQQRVGGAHRRAQHAGRAWDGRSGEIQASITATWQVQVFDPRNPRYNAMRLAVGEFISDVLLTNLRWHESRVIERFMWI